MPYLVSWLCATCWSWSYSEHIIWSSFAPSLSWLVFAFHRCHLSCVSCIGFSCMNFLSTRCLDCSVFFVLCCPHFCTWILWKDLCPRLVFWQVFWLWHVSATKCLPQGNFQDQLNRCLITTILIKLTLVTSFDGTWSKTFSFYLTKMMRRET